MNYGRTLLEINSIILNFWIKQYKEFNLQMFQLLPTKKTELDYTSDKLLVCFICIHDFIP